MTQLKEILDVNKLKEHVLMGHISQMWHHRNPYLCIYNYTHICQHDNIWDEVTELTRGLIVDDLSGEILARPFRKFFNLNTSFRPETLEENLPAFKPRVLEKLDGSLGILYHYNDATGSNIPAIATRGSFASDQAKWATEWYQKNLYNFHEPAEWPEGYTPLFEIIYKENRIVVDYDYEGLVLLGLVNIKTGFELSPEEVQSYAYRNNIRCVREHPGLDLIACKSDRTPNTEGFVLQYWSNKAPIPLRIKIKNEDYCRLHKIITGLNPKGIWEHLMNGFEPKALWWTATSKPEFVRWCQGWIETFQKLFLDTEKRATMAFGKACVRLHKNGQNSKKDYALIFQENLDDADLLSVLYAMRDGKDYKKLIWKQLEPKMDGKEAYIKNADTNNGI